MSDESGEGLSFPRLTADVLRAVLANNEGLEDRTYFSSKNFRDDRHYRIENGELRVNSKTKTSWADSRQEHDFIADDDTARRFIRERKGWFDLDGVGERAAAFKTERKAREAEERARRAVEQKTAPLEMAAAGHGDSSSGSKVPVVLVGIAAIGGLAFWGAPHIKRAWQEKAQPRLDAWRAKRRRG